MQNRRFDVVALGEAMVEFNQTQAGQPQFLQGFGGDTSNAAIAAARAGTRAAYVTRVGNDPFGRALLGLWAQEGVDTHCVSTHDTEATGIYFVTHGDTGHEFSYRRAGSAASGMTPQWLAGAPAVLIREAQCLHLSGITMAISPSACDTAFEAMDIARAAGTRICFDTNLRLKLWPLARARACIQHAASFADYFLPSLEDMQTLTGLAEAEAIVNWCHSHGARQVVLKLGPDGALASDGHRRQHLPGRKVELRDATGAGDCFCGNFLARLALGDDLFAATAYANAAASLAVQGFGAVGPLPRAADVLAII